MFALTYTLPYEGSTVVWFGSLEEIKDWLRERPTSVSLEDIDDIFKVEETYDAYQLYNEAVQ